MEGGMYVRFAELPRGGLWCYPGLQAYLRTSDLTLFPLYQRQTRWLRPTASVHSP